jgi:RNA polymerase sigma factor (sigma-70 family)
MRMLDDDGRTRLETVYRDVGDDLWRAIFAYAGGRREIADDAVAEAFAQAARRLRSIRDLKPWVFRAAFKIAAGELQRRTRTPAVERVDAVAYDDRSVAEYVELTNELSPSQRRAFVLRDLLGYPTADAAMLLGTSEVSVRVHLHAARKRLRGALEEEALS